jgi:hypothetical protein
VEIVRLGWYGGSGGRRLTCLVGSSLDPSCAKDEPGEKQPAPPAPSPATGEVDAGWRVTDRLQIPTDWISGYYLAILKVTAGADAGQTGFVPFIVQAPPGDRSTILVQVPTNTWQAYNTWGGRDLYTTPKAIKVSFNRPYQHRHLFRWEYPLVRFLERSGYDVTYATDDDVDRDPAILLDHRLDIAAGHGEYWTTAERDGWQAARAHGVNLAFMGANAGYWQVRYEDGDRTMVSYKSPQDPEPDPALKTREFRNLEPPRPECQLLGEQSGQEDSETGAYFDYNVTGAGARDPWLRGTGLKPGSAIPGVVGFELDRVRPHCRTLPLTVLFRFGKPRPGEAPLVADAVKYRACSGSEVFDAGSMFFAWGLDGWRDPEYSPPSWPPPPPPSSALQQVMSNAIADLVVPHPRIPAGTVRVAPRGSALRIDPGVAFESLTVHASVWELTDGGLRAVRLRGISTRHARAWRPHVPASAVALALRVSMRTGDVRDSRSYLVRVAGQRMLGQAAMLSVSNCYGSRASLRTPVLAGASPGSMRIALRQMPRSRIEILHGASRVEVVRAGRAGRRGRLVRLPAENVPCGQLQIRISAGARRFRLGGLRACPREPGRTS